MLPEKPWRAGAIFRLLLCLLTCQFLAVTALAVAQFAGGQSEHSTWTFGAAAGGSLIFVSLTILLTFKPWPSGDFEKSFLVRMICFFCAFACSGAAQHLAGKPADVSTLRVMTSALFFNGAALLFMPRFLREHQLNWREAFGFSVNWKWALACGILGAIIFLPVGLLLKAVSDSAVQQFGGHPEAQGAVQALGNAHSWRGRFALGAFAIVLAPVVEEILFRGILYPAVKRLGYPRLALWSVSVVFAVIHTNLPTFLPLLVLAVMLTRLYESTGNLLAPIAVHSLFNAANFTMFFWGEKITHWISHLFPAK